MAPVTANGRLEQCFHFYAKYTRKDLLRSAISGFALRIAHVYAQIIQN
jgi:hypothetical protein